VTNPDAGPEGAGEAGAKWAKAVVDVVSDVEPDDPKNKWPNGVPAPTESVHGSSAGPEPQPTSTKTPSGVKQAPLEGHAGNFMADFNAQSEKPTAAESDPEKPPPPPPVRPRSGAAPVTPQSNEGSPPNQEFASNSEQSATPKPSDASPEVDPTLSTAHAAGEKSQQPAGLPSSVEGLVVDLERVTGERDTYLESSQRIQAEFENYRKQVAQREAMARERANEGFVKELLPVLDACDSAMVNGSEDVAIMRNALFDAMTKQGLERIDPVDAPFDPEFHEAVMHEDGDGSTGPVVVEVMRAGYSWNGRVVRPAMVKVQG